MDQNQLSALLAAMRSPDNEARKQAEAEYDQFTKSQPVWMMLALAEVCAGTEDTATVTLVLILLRKLFNVTSALPDGSSQSAFATADAETQEAVKGRLLQVLGTAAVGPQRGSAAACVSALAVAVDKSEGKWPQLWTNVFGILSSPETSNELKTLCCEIIATVASNMTQLFKENHQSVSTGLQLCLRSGGGNTKALKEAAFKAIIELAPLDFKDEFSPLVPDMLSSVQVCLDAKDWETAETLLRSIVQGIADCPSLFDAQSVFLLTGLMQVASSVEVSKDVAHVAVEALLTFCEELPKAARKVTGFATSFFQLLFQYLLNPKFQPNWDETLDLEAEGDDNEEATDFLIACAGLDRLAIAIGGRKLKSTAEKLFGDNIQAEDWKHRHAALALICHITEGMKTAFVEQLGMLVQVILSVVGDEVKYVRAIALETLAQLCQDFSPDLQNNFHTVVIPKVVGCLSDSVPHVAASAARCLDSFFDYVSGDEEEVDDDPEVAKTFAPYAERVSNDCVVLLTHSQNLQVQESALGALSSLISTVKVHMQPFVRHLVPVFESVIQQPDAPERVDCKCKAIECMTLLAAGVGKEAMGDYASSICGYLSTLCAQGLTNDDTRFRYVLRGWTCMVECMKKDVLPYMDNVMPMLINLMNVECDVVITEAPVGDDDDQMDEAAEEAAHGVESVRIVIPGVGERIAKMHTGLIEDKELASNVTNAILMELGGDLHKFFPQLVSSAIQLLDFKVNDSIRESGALILNAILEAYQKVNAPEMVQVAAQSFEPLLACLAEEPEENVMETLVECISVCVSSCPQVLTQQNVAIVSEKLSSTLTVMVKKRTEALQKKATEQDEDELDELEEVDAAQQSNIRSITTLIGTLLEKASAVFAPVFSTRFFPLVAEWLQPQVDDFFVSRGLVIICDFVEHAPNQVAAVLPTLMSCSLAFATSRKDEEVLQADFYLINNLVQFLGVPANNTGNVNTADFAMQSQQALSTYLSSPAALSAPYLGPTANAVSAYVSLLQFFYQSLGQNIVSGMLQTLVTALPCDDDEIEAQRVHDRLLGFIVGHHPVLQSYAGASEAILARIKTAKAENLSAAAQQQLAAM